MPDDDLTIAPTPAPKPASTPAPTTPRFVPGAMIGGRYRLVALLGRGGMGEVYRADDLTLDHPVALKFLPENVAHDGARLAQFHNELRVARQVSHKNVCRLYDLGEADGRPFLTMEYVDGEDLASLLRRIGRLPPDKAIEIARQLCAGVAAAHERGVLHRDLKPANVMIDGEGHVRITDFGLASAASDVTAAAAAGTPQYMAPELLGVGHGLQGRPGVGHGLQTVPQASVKTDIYALGLILFEIFTGRRAYDARSLNDLLQLHESGTVPLPSSVVRDLDPAVERVILRCLERDPAKRPGSALGVAAALPGGDPLAAALAAGETPSPEMVAGASDESAIHPIAGLSIVAFVVAGLLALAVLGDRFQLAARVPLDKSVDVLEDRAREIVEKLGYTERPADTARGISINTDYVNYVARTRHDASRWDVLATNPAGTIRLWYRTSPRDLTTLSTSWRPTRDDPPLVVSNMVTVVVDTRGRLIDFAAVAPQVDAAPSPGATDWTRLFDAAALPIKDFQPAAPQWTPRVYADERAAWEGPLPGQPETRVRVEAAAFHGRPVSFFVVGPWTRPTRMQQDARSTRSRVVSAVATIVLVVVLCGTVALARHNLRAGRGDRRGAARLSLFILGLSFVAFALGGRHFLDVQVELNHFLNNFCADALLLSGLMWLLYVALEPYVRRYRPDILVSWTRLLGGQLRDARVGRDLLVGTAVGVFLGLFNAVPRLLGPLFGSPPAVPRIVRTEFLLGARYAASALLMMVPNSLFNMMAATLLFVVLRVVLRRVWLAAGVAIALFAVLVMGEMGEDSLIVGLLFGAVFSGALFGTLLYFGLVAQATAFLVNQMLANSLLTADLSKPYAATAVWVLLTIGGAAAYGFYASRAGQPLFGDLLAHE